MRYERAIGLNMSGLFTARDARLFQKNEENGIIFQKVANIGINTFLENLDMYGFYKIECVGRFNNGEAIYKLVQ